MLCQMGPKRVHQLGLSRQQPFACSEQHGKGLLLSRFNSDPRFRSDALLLDQFVVR
jgi:hypothetical protein